MIDVVGEALGRALRRSTERVEDPRDKRIAELEAERDRYKAALEAYEEFYSATLSAMDNGGEVASLRARKAEMAVRALAKQEENKS